VAERNELINRTLDRYDQREFIPQETREVAIEKTLHDISVELSLDYLFSTQGTQIFELVIDGQMLSKLVYPHRGGLAIVKGEIGYLSKFFIGGKFATSNFRRRLCTDEDWSFYDPDWIDEYVDYQITKQMCKSKVGFFDVNLYYRLLDLNEEEVKKMCLSAKEDTIFDFLLINSLSLDIFGGYQQQKGSYRMIDPMTEALRYDEEKWYYDVSLPDDIGLDSFYKVKYAGPRIGLRAKGALGKLTTTINFAYAWLKASARGWWNIREYAFWQSGHGYGLDFEVETTYPITPSFSFGMGYHFFIRNVEKLKMSGELPGFNYYDEDICRHVDSTIYGPSVIFKYIW